MNPNDSPLLPQGSFLEQKNKGRTRAKIAVFVVLAIHGIGLMALLMQGCKPNTGSKDYTGAATNAVTPEFVDTNLPVVEETNVAYTAPTNSPVPPELGTNQASSGITQHKIVKGDNFSTLAKKYKVSVNAIQEANPGVDPSKLKIGDTLRIPAPSPALVTSTPGTPASEGGAETTYTVKSGDNLIKIANQFGTTVKAIRSANGLRTDKIKVGDHLKIPARTNAATLATTTNANQ